jgi:hypothetical protein
MEYNGYLIEEDKTGYAPKHLRFSFFTDDGEKIIGSGESVEDCEKQIDELNLDEIHKDTDLLKPKPKSAMLEMIEVINNRSDNSLKTKFTEEEKKFWLEKEKAQIIEAFGNGEYMVFVKDRLDYDHEDYNFSNSDEYYDFTFNRNVE